MKSFFNGPPFPPCHRDYSAEQRYIEKVRRKTVGERLRFTLALSAIDMILMRQEIRIANPNVSEEELNILFVAKVYGQDLADRVRDYIEKKRQAAQETDG